MNLYSTNSGLTARNRTEDAQTRNNSVAVEGGQTLYVLSNSERTLGKIGRSRKPLDRIIGLMYANPEIDLNCSALIGIDTHRIETVLHTVFGKRRKPLDRRTDGYTEWFVGDIVEEVIEFCQHVGEKRGCQYPVTRGIEDIIRNYRNANPLAGRRAPRLSEKQSRARKEKIKREFSERAFDRVSGLIDVLSEKDLDGLANYRDQYYLVRTVEREEKPEAWETGASLQSTAWSKRVAAAADIALDDMGAVCHFRLLKSFPLFPIDDLFAYEIFRINEAPISGRVTDDATPDAHAAEQLWDFLVTLDQLDSSELESVLAN